MCSTARSPSPDSDEPPRSEGGKKSPVGVGIEANELEWDEGFSLEVHHICGSLEFVLYELVADSTTIALMKLNGGIEEEKSFPLCEDMKDEQPAFCSEGQKNDEYDTPPSMSDERENYPGLGGNDPQQRDSHH